jgi:hypothetical protein
MEESNDVDLILGSKCLAKHVETKFSAMQTWHFYNEAMDEIHQPQVPGFWIE